MRKLSLFLLSLIFVFTMSCNNEEATENNTENDSVNVVTETAVFNTVDEMVEAAKAEIELISAEDFKTKIDAEESFLLIDVRSMKEFNKGYILGSVNIPRGILEFKIKKESFWEEEMLYMPKSDELIIIYCKSGKRAILATSTLKSMGFTNVKSLTEGFKDFSKVYPDATEIPEGSDEPAEGGEADDGGC